MALTVSIFDHNVNNVNSFKYLGISISSDFTWTNHVEYIAGKINQRLGLLNRIKDFNSLSQAIRQSVNLNIFKRNLFQFVIK